jgi:hypothetical protein
MNPDTPQGLLNKVLFETILYFCRRDRENIRELEASDFEIKVDADNSCYVVKVKSEQTKNHTGTTNENEGDGGRMYETGGIKCPVICINVSSSKLSSISKKSISDKVVVELDNEGPYLSNSVIVVA